MHMLEISAKLQNAEISLVTLLKSASITDAHPTNFKNSPNTHGKFFNGVSFSMAMVGGLNKLNCFKGRYLKCFSRNFLQLPIQV